jgi:hypothetical protein
LNQSVFIAVIHSVYTIALIQDNLPVLLVAFQACQPYTASGLGEKVAKFQARLFEKLTFLFGR